METPTQATIETVTAQWRDALARFETARRLLGHATAIPLEEIMGLPTAVQEPTYTSGVWADHYRFLAAYANLVLAAFEKADKPGMPSPAVPHIGSFASRTNPDAPSSLQLLKLAAYYRGGQEPPWLSDREISHVTGTKNTVIGVILAPQGVETWIRRQAPTDPTDPVRATISVLFGHLHWGGEPEHQDHRYRDGRRPGLHRLPDPRVTAREALARIGVPADLAERWCDSYRPWWAAWEHEIVGLYRPREWEPWVNEAPGFTPDHLTRIIRARISRFMPWEFPRGWDPDLCRRVAEEVAQEVFGRKPSPWM